MKRSLLLTSVLLMPLSALVGAVLYLLSLCLPWGSALQQAPFKAESAAASRRKRRWLLLGLCGLSVLTAFFTQAPLEHLAGLLARYLVLGLLYLGFVRALQRGLLNSAELSKAWLASVFLLTLVALGNYFLHWQAQPQLFCLQGYGQPCLLDLLLLAEDRARSFSMHPNVLGVMLMLSLPLWWHQALADSRRWLWLSGLSLTGLALLVSFSRGAWLGAAVALPLSVFVIKPASIQAVQHTSTVSPTVNKHFRNPWLLVVSLLALTSTLSWLFQPLQQALQRTGTADTRLQIWSAGLEIVSQHPWTGVGLLQVEKAYQQLMPQGPPAGHLHNIYLQLAAESGLPFLLLLLLALGWFFKPFPATALGRACGLSLLSFGIASWVDVTLLDLRVLFSLTLLAALFRLEVQQSRYFS